MGVFSRFRRKSAEASTEEAAAATLTAESSDAEGGEPGAETASAAERDGAAAADGKPSAEENGEPAAAESVEIPKQQSAEEAADSEAGEGARK
ncbi:gliding motility protein [Streptomyces sp. NPDC059788]|uniref:gliding motility protein n=1 Tax=Streptomyces sp. NPDC059788 TaxID=3346948 RepID=UPI00365A40AD